MKKIFARDGLTLAPGTARQLSIAQDGNLLVLQGQLWITIAGRPEDHWLSSRQALGLQAGDRITVEAQSEEAILILQPSRIALATVASRWNLRLPMVTQVLRNNIQAKRAIDVTNKFFQQWARRQPQVGRN